MPIPEEISKLKPSRFGAYGIHSLQGGKYYDVYQTYSIYDRTKKGTGKRQAKLSVGLPFVTDFFPTAMSSPS